MQGKDPTGMATAGLDKSSQVKQSICSCFLLFVFSNSAKTITTKRRGAATVEAAAAAAAVVCFYVVVVGFV